MIISEFRFSKRESCFGYLATKLLKQQKFEEQFQKFK